jgi:hypothetical protein
MRRALNRLALVLLLPLPGWTAAEMQTSRNPETGLLSWKIEHEGLSIELVQVLPDFVRAAYEARGLPDWIIEDVASYCVLGTIVVNKSDGPVSYRVADWRYVGPDGKEQRLKTKSEWTAEWKAGGVPYNWSILPDDQTLQVGDWSQGFTTVKLPRESEFDLIYTWSTDAEEHEGRFEGLRCPPEEAPGR